MSKSKKKQRARARLEQGPPEEQQTLVQPESSGAPVLDEGLYRRVVATVRTLGIRDEEASRVVYLYNGDTLSIKFTEADTEAGARLLVAAFRCGVVFQVEDGRVLVQMVGDWQTQLCD